MGKNFRKEFWKPILLQQDLNCKLFSPLNFLLKYVFQNIFVLHKESKQSLFFLHETGWKNIVWVKKTLQFHFQVSNIKKKCRNLERLSWCNSPTTVSHTQKNNDKLISGWCLFFWKKRKFHLHLWKLEKEKERSQHLNDVWYFIFLIGFHDKQMNQFSLSRSGQIYWWSIKIIFQNFSPSISEITNRRENIWDQTMIKHFVICPSGPL